MWIVPSLFLLVGIVGFTDYGTTWDERESLEAGNRNLLILSAAWRGESAPPWPWHELTGYQFLVDTVRAAFVELAAPRFVDLAEAERPLAALHLFHLLLATASLALTQLVVTSAGGSRRIAVLAALALAATPKFVAHAVNNPKDLVGLLVFVLALAIATRTFAGVTGPAGPRRLVATGAALGFAAAHHVVSVFLAPLLAVVERWRSGAATHRRVGELAAIAGIGAATTVFIWPWLWPAPLERMRELFARAARPRFQFDVFYLGRLFPNDELPWHYSLGSLAVATPLFLFIAAAGGTALAATRSAPPAARRLAGLGALWFALPLAVDLFAPRQYDGARHFLFALPALAILAALGLDRAWSVASAPAAAPRAAARAALALAAALWLWTVAELVAYHPYQDAYLNATTRTIVDGRPEETFATEYWGSTYREAARWVASDANGRGVVYVPRAGHCAAPYLGAGLLLVEAFPRQATKERSYVVVMLRRGKLGRIDQRLRDTREPAYVIERRGTRLVEIYRFARGGLVRWLAADSARRNRARLVAAPPRDSG